MPPKSKKIKKPKEEVEPDDEYMKMDYKSLTNNIDQLKEKYNDIKSKRNYIQQDRDVIEKFYHNTSSDIENIQRQTIVLESNSQSKEEDHQMEVKVYLQKVKHLEYEQEKKNKEIENDGQQAEYEENKYFRNRLKDMGVDKKNYKRSQNGVEQQNINKVITQNDTINKAYIYQSNEFNKKIDKLNMEYEEKLQKLKKELELKLKVEIHEIEERKNLHINELINNHNNAFTELKQYYNSITADNLNQIKFQKENINRLIKEGENNEIEKKKLANLINELLVPLKEKNQEKNKLEKELKQYDKHKMNLQNIKAKLIIMQDNAHKLSIEKEELNLQYEKQLDEKNRLRDKFEIITQEVQRNTDLQNVILYQRLQELESQLAHKEHKLQVILNETQMDNGSYQNLKNRIQESLEHKNNLIKNLKYSIHHATKAYNDAIRVYEAKLVEFGIPPDELGFQPLETKTSTMPAGLVSS